MIVTVEESGRLRFHGDMPLEGFDLEIVERRRVSVIVPASPLKRLAFRIIRFLAGDWGAVVQWTRGWTGPWQVRWLDRPGQVAFQHNERSACVEYERRKLDGNE